MDDEYEMIDATQFAQLRSNEEAMMQAQEDMRATYAPYSEAPTTYAPVPYVPPASMPTSQVASAPVPLYDISLANSAGATDAQPSFFAKRIGGLPVWGWGLLGGAAVGAAYYMVKKKSVTQNPVEERPPPMPLPEKRDSEWRPSRSEFGDSLQSWVRRRGIPRNDVTVYTDADEAKMHVQPVSPLVTIKCVSTVTMPMDELQKFCDEHGLIATDHGKGVIGFYPATSGERGRKWEEYIDALRDDGQTV